MKHQTNIRQPNFAIDPFRAKLGALRQVAVKMRAKADAVQVAVEKAECAVAAVEAAYVQYQDTGVIDELLWSDIDPEVKKIASQERARERKQYRLLDDMAIAEAREVLKQFGGWSVAASAEMAR